MPTYDFYLLVCNFFVQVVMCLIYLLTTNRINVHFVVTE